MRFDKDGKVSRFGPILLREGYFRPERVTAEGGIDPILRGSVHIPCQEIDSKVVDELRNFLFPTNGRGLDLGAINIQRGRDTGIADYNSVRKALGLHSKFSKCFMIHLKTDLQDSGQTNYKATIRRYNYRVPAISKFQICGKIKIDNCTYRATF